MTGLARVLGAMSPAQREHGGQCDRGTAVTRGLAAQANLPVAENGVLQPVSVRYQVEAEAYVDAS